MTVDSMESATEVVPAARTPLDELASKDLLERYGFPRPRGVRWSPGTTVGEDTPLPDLGHLTPPLAVKALDGALVHKSRYGGVALGAGSPAEVADAAAGIQRRLEKHGISVGTFLVEEQAEEGVELILGGFRDEAFGPRVMVGVGGALAEALGEVVFGLCPLREDEAERMLDELPSLKAWQGVGQISQDQRATLVEMLLALGGAEGLMMSDSLVEEVDINPVILTAGSSAIAVDAAVVLARGPRTCAQERRPPVNLDQLLLPSTIAVIGVSGSGSGPGNTFLRNLTAQGFTGQVYVVHPSASELEGFACVRSLAEIPAQVDYAFVSVSAERVPDLVRQAHGRVAFMQVMSSGFGESLDGRDLDQDLRSALKEGDVRLLGPNCLGTYSPRGGLTFVKHPPAAPGSVAFLSQSGGLAADVINMGGNCGLRFSGVVSLGNCADLSAPDLLPYFLSDSQTSVVGLYLESSTDARRLFETLRSRPAGKPVVILRGGTTGEGRRSALSHTGALSGDDKAWRALARQAGVTMVATLWELIHTLRIFEVVDGQEGAVPSDGGVVVAGNGGGFSVLAADAVAQSGLALHHWDAQALEAFAALDIPPGMSVANPIDLPATAIALDGGRVVREVFGVLADYAQGTVLMAHLNLPVVADNLSHAEEHLDRYVALVARASESLRSVIPAVIILRSDGSERSERLWSIGAELATQAGLPVFREFDDAVLAVRNVVHWLTLDLTWVPA